MNGQSQLKHSDSPWVAWVAKLVNFQRNNWIKLDILKLYEML